MENKVNHANVKTLGYVVQLVECLVCIWVVGSTPTLHEDMAVYIL